MEKLRKLGKLGGKGRDQRLVLPYWLEGGGNGYLKESRAWKKDFAYSKGRRASSPLLTN